MWRAGMSAVNIGPGGSKPVGLSECYPITLANVSECYPITLANGPGSPSSEAGAASAAVREPPTAAVLREAGSAGRFVQGGPQRRGTRRPPSTTV